RRAARAHGLHEVAPHSERWALCWTDLSVGLERALSMKAHQTVNHFPGMVQLCRKDCLARNMQRMRRLLPSVYSESVPRTWCLPHEYAVEKGSTTSGLGSGRVFIVKPHNGCQGRGIFLTRSPGTDTQPLDRAVCQEYIARPLLLGGYKFDARVYALLTMVDPPRIYVYREGLARLATHPYRSPTAHNMDDVCMHLTNYAINKRSDGFVRDESTGSKR
ncbi:unnamed protein product, partial [Lampetra fluviatilis]